MATPAPWKKFAKKVGNRIVSYGDANGTIKPGTSKGDAIVHVVITSNEIGVLTQTLQITYQGPNGNVKVMSLWESQKWSNLLYCTLL